MSEPRYNLHAYFAHDLEAGGPHWTRLRRWLDRRNLEATIGRATSPAQGPCTEVVVPHISDARAVEFLAVFTPLRHEKHRE